MRDHTFLMKIRFLLLFLVILSGQLCPGYLFSAESEEEKKLGQQLKTALEEYNQAPADGKFDARAFWLKKNMISESLRKLYKNHSGFEFDPFVNSQETAPGFVIKRVKINGDAAQVQVELKPFSASEKPTGMIYLMRHEDDCWKIDDIDYGFTTFRKILSSPSAYD